MEFHVASGKRPHALLRLYAPLAEQDLPVVVDDAPHHVSGILIMDMPAGATHVPPVVLRTNKMKVHF